jgi:hypothetical protein
MTKTAHVVIRSNESDYVIYCDDNIIVDTHNALTPYQEVLQILGFEYIQVSASSTAKTSASIKEAHEAFQNKAMSNDNADTNSGLPDFGLRRAMDLVEIDEPVLGAYRETFSDQSMYSEQSETPVTQKTVPELGDEVYIPESFGFSKIVHGGFGIVSAVVKDPSSNNYFVSLESIQSELYNWSEINHQQSQLKEKYGNKPAFVTKRF